MVSPCEHSRTRREDASHYDASPDDRGPRFRPRAVVVCALRSVLFTYTKSPMLTGHPSTTTSTSAQDGTLVVVVVDRVVVDRVVRVAREASTTTRVCVCARVRYGTVRRERRDARAISPHSWVARTDKALASVVSRARVGSTSVVAG